MSVRTLPSPDIRAAGRAAADAPAVSDTREELTYRQLDERASRLAAVIRRETGGPGAGSGCTCARNAVVVAILAY
ncbi:hypothetical protein GXW82_08480 [Streptacidiphilus sp. 4-A2]|nr:hypothetical protein [Streptacidiphilus sp. 4-A2]